MSISKTLNNDMFYQNIPGQALSEKIILYEKSILNFNWEEHVRIVLTTSPLRRLWRVFLWEPHAHRKIYQISAAALLRDCNCDGPAHSNVVWQKNHRAEPSSVSSFQELEESLRGSTGEGLAIPNEVTIVSHSPFLRVWRVGYVTLSEVYVAKLLMSIVESDGRDRMEETFAHRGDAKERN